MKYIKSFESRYKAQNIDKKYYVWKNQQYVFGERMAIIEIVSIIKGDIKYRIIKRTDEYVSGYGYRDFFTNKKYSDNWDVYKISLDYWKRNMYGNLLFDTDDKQSAIDFYETYDVSKKYNL